MELSLADLKTLIGATDIESPYPIGSAVIVRSVTHYYTGRIVACTPTWLRLADAAWIADTGRWSDALATGALNEVEPFVGEVCIGVGAIIDITPWTHDLPRAKK